MKEIVKEISIMISFILIGILSRVLLVNQGLQPFPNFEVITILTFVGLLLMRPTFAIMIPICSLVGSDMIIGTPIFVDSSFNRIIMFTYSGIALLGLVGLMAKNKIKNVNFNLKSIGMFTGLGVGLVLLYDIWTNIGWWYLFYPHTLATLATTFVMGLPFMIYHMLSAALTFGIVSIPILYYLNNKSIKDLKYNNIKYENIYVSCITLILIILSVVKI